MRSGSRSRPILHLFRLVGVVLVVFTSSSTSLCALSSEFKLLLPLLAPMGVVDLFMTGPHLDLGRGFSFAGGFDGLLALARRQRLRWQRPSLAKAVLALYYTTLARAVTNTSVWWNLYPLYTPFGRCLYPPVSQYLLIKGLRCRER
jgi:hypothetical protein